jgi:glycosyltransferase involved in cell wall biosynthesis
MNILIPTVYPLISGSTRVLLAAHQALMSDHQAVVRAPFPNASEHPSFSFPITSLDTVRDKLRALPLVIRAIRAERKALAGRNIDVIYVHDDLSLYVYGFVARLIGAKVVRHIHMYARASLEVFRAPLANYSIHISKHARGDTAGSIIRNPVRNINVKRRPIDRTLVLAGSICRNKNQLLAVELLGILNKDGFDGRLSLCGEIIEPDYAVRVRQRIDELGLADRVQFEGFVDPRHYLETAHAMLVPSFYENQPLGLLEAVSAGVPVVASDIAAHRELSSLGCIEAKNLQPLELERFATAVFNGGNITSENIQRVRELFSEQQFSEALRSFFAEIKNRMSGHGVEPRMQVGSQI